MMKMTVLYHSVTGNTKTMAQVIAEGMMTVAGVEAKAFPIENWDAAWVKESKCVVLGTPIYLADLCSAVKVWLDGPALKAGLAGKVGGAFATADYLHGGGDLGIQTILNHMMVLGMLTYSGGGSFGKPVIHLGLWLSTDTWRRARSSSVSTVSVWPPKPFLCSAERRPMQRPPPPGCPVPDGEGRFPVLCARNFTFITA